MDHCKICGGNHATETCDTAVRAAGGAAPSSPAPPERPELAVGNTVGNYRLVKVVGEGASSKIFLAEHQVIGSKVAVKALRPALHRHPDLVRRFVGEARATNIVRHDNIVQIYDIGLHDDWQYYFVMEFLRGTTLAPRIQQGPMSLEEAAPILLQTCDALNAAHSHGVVHRDLKPENIYLVPMRDRTQVKIVDFGVARRAVLEGDEQRTMAGTVLGTALYMSPEQAAGQEVDGRSDIYALGVIMFQLATGQLPFDANSIAVLMLAHASRPPPSPRSVNPDISPAYEEVILRCLAKAPAERYQTMADLGRAILHAQKNPRMPTPRPAPPPPAANHPVRYPAAFDVRIETDAGVLAAQCRATDISTGGAFISVAAGSPLPPVFSRVVVSVPHHAEMIDLPGEVVRVEAQPDPDMGGRFGFGVRFDPIALSEKRGLDSLLGKVVPEPPKEEPGDPELARLLAHFEARPREDLYALIGTAPHIDARTARDACTRLALELSAERFPRMSEAQRKRLTALHDRLANAEEVLVDPSRRAQYDAGRGNFVGVARCVSAGLPVAELGALRNAFLRTHPGADARARAQAAQADAAEARGDLEVAVSSLAKALEVDPLSYDLQRRFWDLRRRLGPKRESA